MAKLPTRFLHRTLTHPAALGAAALGMLYLSGLFFVGVLRTDGIEPIAAVTVWLDGALLAAVGTACFARGFARRQWGYPAVGALCACGVAWVLAMTLR